MKICGSGAKIGEETSSSARDQMVVFMQEVQRTLQEKSVRMYDFKLEGG